MHGIGDGVKHHPGPAEHAGPLAHGARQAFPVAGHLVRLFALAVNLIRSFFEYEIFHGWLPAVRDISKVQ
jgi:hypothetical protein